MSFAIKRSSSADMKSAFQATLGFPVTKSEIPTVNLDRLRKKCGEGDKILDKVGIFSQQDDEMDLISTGHYGHSNRDVEMGDAQFHEESIRTSSYENVLYGHRSTNFAKIGKTGGTWQQKQRVPLSLCELGKEQQRHSQLQVTHSEVQKGLFQKQEEALKWQKRYENLQCEWDNLQAINVALNRAVEKKEDDIKILNNSRDQLKEKLAAAKQTYRKFQEKYDEKIQYLKELCINQRAELEDLETTNSTLTESLDEAQDKILRLQPYVQDISIRQAEIEYDQLCDGIQTWVEKILGPIIDNNHIRAAVLEKSYINLEITRALIDELTECEKQAAKFPETESHILVALIMRMVKRDVLDNKFAGINSNELRSIRIIEQSMLQLKPERDPSVISDWKTETHYAIINSKTHERNRSIRAKDLARKFGKVMQLFAFKVSLDEYYDSIQHAIVSPAIELTEKLQISRNIFRFQQWSLDGIEQPHTTCAINIKHFECSDLFQHGKKFDPEKLMPIPTRAELTDKLKYLCTTTPEMGLSSIQGNNLSELQILRKAKILVTWGESPDPVANTRNLFAGLIEALEVKGTRSWWQAKLRPS